MMVSDIVERTLCQCIESDISYCLIEYPYIFPKWQEDGISFAICVTLYYYIQMPMLKSYEL